MHFYFLGFGFVVFLLFKTGRLNLLVKKALQKSYAKLYRQTENFNDYISVKEIKNEDDQEIESGFYTYQATGGVVDAISYLDFKIDFSLSFNTANKRLKQGIVLSKGNVKHKFVVEGDYSLNGKVITFTPTEGDLSILPEELRENEIKFIVEVKEGDLLLSFNEDQMGKAHSLTFEKN